MIPQSIEIAQQHLLAGQTAAAEAIARQILTMDAKNPTAMQILGLVAAAAGQHEQAVGFFEKAISLSPDPDAEMIFQLGETYRQLLRLDEAVSMLDRAIAKKNDHADAHLSLALALMLLGQYERGFKEFEWRWKSTKLNTQRINFQQPTWDGSNPAGRTILIWAEQGLGDVIQCVRYVPLMAQRGAKVVIGCQLPLQRVLTTVPGVSVVASKFEETPPFHLQISSFSVLHAFGTAVPTIPQNVPYLSANPALAAKWKQHLSADQAKLKVGLVWAGRVDNPTDAQRSIPITTLAPLAALKNISFYSLQIDDRAPQASAAMGFKPLGPHLTDLAETAAVLANLDLLITVDTAPAHLAGAMGRPVWNLIAWFNDWRWMLERSDSPWYPTMRLFRQKQRGIWNAVIQEVAKELFALSGG